MNESALRQLCKKHGVEWNVPPTSQPLEQRSYQQLAHGTDGASKHTVYRMKAEAEESDRIGGETGQPGTPLGRSGRVRPAVGEYGPRTVRGSHGQWGLYEEHFRSEPQVFDPVTSIAETLAAANYEVQAPKTVNRSQQSAIDDFVDWSNGWLHSIAGGIRRHVAEAGETLLIYGPCVHEVVWGTDGEGRKHPTKFGYREPSTYDEWILDDDEAELDAIKFRTYNGGSYLLRTGSDLRSSEPSVAPTTKAIHAAYHQRGHNFDGIPPQRPGIVFKKLKELLIQIAGLTADKYGVPIGKVMDAPADLDGDWSPPEGSADSGDKSQLFKQVKHQRSGRAPVLKIPSGLDVQYESPEGTMPTLIELLEYCDQQVAQSYKNEGSLLGQTSAVGSYALGKVSDDKFLRKAPATAQAVLRPINRLLRLTAQAYVEPDVGSLPAYPRAHMRLGAGIDASKWLEDVRESMGGVPMTQWPTTLQEAALEKLDLPKDALEADGDTEIGGTAEAEDATQPDEAQ